MSLHTWLSVCVFTYHLNGIHWILLHANYSQTFIRWQFGILLMKITGTIYNINLKYLVSTQIDRYALLIITSIISDQVVNLYGISFVDDTHVELLSSNCIHLECLALNFCLRVKGSTLKTLIQRCKKLQALLMQHCGRFFFSLDIPRYSNFLVWH